MDLYLHSFQYYQIYTGGTPQSIMDLAEALRSVKRQLPPGYNLPYSIKRLDMYYQNIPVEFIASVDSAVVVLVLPVYRESNHFLLYKLVQVPVSRDNVHAYQYDLENN